MVNNVVAQYLKENKQGVSCDENILHISLKHFALLASILVKKSATL